MLRRWWII
jgi:hypothetical protein